MKLIPIRKNGMVFIGFLIILISGLMSYFHVLHNYNSLNFHTRDYAFYSEFIIKLMDSDLINHYTMNPGGYNMFGITAIDGCSGFFQWVHMEPVRFIQAFIFYLFDDLRAVFIFNIVLIYLPFILIVNSISNQTNKTIISIILILSFIFFPSLILVAGYDNRPSMFLGSFYFFQLYSWLFSKNRILRIVSFFLMFLIREEALIFNFLILLVAYGYLKLGELKKNTFYVLLSGYLAYLLFVVGYFIYWEYSISKLNTFILLIVFFFSILMIAIIYFQKLLVYKHTLLPLFLFVPLVFVPVQYFLMYMNGAYPQESYTWWNDPRLALIWFLIIAMIIWKWNQFSEKTSLLFSMTLIVFVVVLNFIPSFKHHALLLRIDNEKDLVQNFIYDSEQNNIILTDYRTHQAFLQFNQNYCIERLPCFLHCRDRFFPNNVSCINQLLIQPCYVLITRKTWNLMNLEELKFNIQGFHSKDGYVFFSHAGIEKQGY